MQNPVQDLSSKSPAPDGLVSLAEHSSGALVSYGVLSSVSHTFIKTTKGFPPNVGYWHCLRYPLLQEQFSAQEFD